MSDYRDLDWEMFTGHMFSKKELDEIYQQGRVDAEEDAENRMQRILDDEKKLSFEQGIAYERERISCEVSDFLKGELDKIYQKLDSHTEEKVDWILNINKRVYEILKGEQNEKEN